MYQGNKRYLGFQNHCRGKGGNSDVTPTTITDADATGVLTPDSVFNNVSIYTLTYDAVLTSLHNEGTFSLIVKQDEIAGHELTLGENVILPSDLTLSIGQNKDDVVIIEGVSDGTYTFIQSIANSTISAAYSYIFEAYPTTGTVLLDYKVTEASDTALTGSDVDIWYNKGLNGIDAAESTNKPTIDLDNNTLLFTEPQQLTLNTPVVLNGDTGWSMLIGMEYGSNDRYVIGSTDGTNGFNVFMRNTSIVCQFSTTSSVVTNYSGWDTKKIGKFILEITHTGESGGILELRLNNGAASTGGSGALLLDRSFFDMIGNSTAMSGFGWNGKVGALRLFNKPFTTEERNLHYAQIAANYGI